MLRLGKFWRAHRRVLGLVLMALALDGVPFLPPAAEAQLPPRARREYAQEAHRDGVRRRISRRRIFALRVAMAERRRRNPELFERNRAGFQVLRGKIIAIDPSPRGLDAMQRLGMRVLRDRNVGELGVRVLVLRAPPRMNAVAALEAMRAADPEGAYELNHVFDPSGQEGSRAAQTRPAMPAALSNAGLRIGMIDGGVDTGHPALAHAHIVAHAFVGKPSASSHGTAVASLLVGADGGFQGAAPGADLYAADVFGEDAEGGSAEAIADAIGWLVSQHVAAINISLEGPPNKLIEIVCRAAAARGVILVAAVGNAGPAAPVAYPAAYPSVVAVTAVDSADQVYLMANRGPQIAFAALGVDVTAAAEGEDYESVSGTSFAAPRITAMLAQERATSPPAAIAMLAAHAHDLGAPGRDATYGYGRAP